MDAQNNIIKKSFDFALKTLMLYSSLGGRKKGIRYFKANSKEWNLHRSQREGSPRRTIGQRLSKTLIKASQWLEGQNIDDLQNDCEELLKILGSIQLSTKKRIRNPQFAIHS